jgi:hypothetical protein
MSKEYLKIEDFTKDFMNGVKSLKQYQTLVGIPEDENKRGPDSNGEQGIGNAALLFINNFGSPANNIPARPVMQIGIKNAQDLITEEMKNAAKKGLSKGVSSIEPYYERVGIIASNSIKRAIDDQIDIEPPSEATLKAREAKGFKGTKALIVTGQMRNSITYVVEG